MDGLLDADLSVRIVEEDLMTARRLEGGLMERLLPVVDQEACTGCVACVDACDRGCLLMVDGVAVLIDADACAGAEHCVESCPIGAIRMESIAL